MDERKWLKIVHVYVFILFDPYSYSPNDYGWASITLYLIILIRITQAQHFALLEPTASAKQRLCLQNQNDRSRFTYPAAELNFYKNTFFHSIPVRLDQSSEKSPISPCNEGDTVQQAPVVWWDFFDEKAFHDEFEEVQDPPPPSQTPQPSQGGAVPSSSSRYSGDRSLHIPLIGTRGRNPTRMQYVEIQVSLVQSASIVNYYILSLNPILYLAMHYENIR